MKTKYFLIFFGSCLAGVVFFTWDWFVFGFGVHELKIPLREETISDSSLQAQLGRIDFDAVGIELEIVDSEILRNKPKFRRKFLGCNGSTDLGYHLISLSEVYDFGWKCKGTNKIILFKQKRL